MQACVLGIAALVAPACGLASTGTGEDVQEAGVPSADGAVAPHDAASDASGMMDAGTLLTLTSAMPGAKVDLTALGPGGWAHWGRNKATDVNLGHDNPTALMLMEGLTVDGGTPTPVQFGDNQTAFSWSNGVPTASESGTTTGIYAKGAHPVWRLTLMADTSVHEAVVFLGGYKSHAALTVTLGTGATQRTVTDLQSNATGHYYLLYTIDYQANAANTPLVVSWEMLVADDTGNGNVTLSAVALK